MARELGSSAGSSVPYANGALTLAKRAIDVTAATVTLLLLLPLLVAFAVLIRLESHGPVIYRSRRMAANGQSFVLYKFRTMYEGSPPIHAGDGSLIVMEDDPRVTRVGRVLRHGLDELPQFVNVLEGHMSLVGPRADPPEALVSYRPEDGERLLMKPGITGLAQVCGRTEIPLDERRNLDLSYVHHWCPRLDLLVCLLTFFELVPGLERLLPEAQQRLHRSLVAVSGTRAGLA